MSYLDFLKLLASLSSKLPQILAAIQELSDWWAKYSPIFIPSDTPKAFGASGDFAVTAEEAVLEAELCAGHEKALEPGTFGAIGDGQILAALRAAWQFLQANPQLMALLLKLLGV